MVAYARSKGTVIVAAAGNEHARIGAGGRVLSHGILWIPGDIPDPVNNPIDFFGMYETPAAIPGVVDVSSTGNVVVGSSASCAGRHDRTATPRASPRPTPTSRPASGSRTSSRTTATTVRGSTSPPRAARASSTCPSADRGGTAGWPVTTADGTTAFEDFSITSNWALEIPCYFNLGPQFYPNECYSTIQGTSMATPHASAVLALIASARPSIAHNVDALVNALEEGAREIHGNTTPGLSATDTSAGRPDRPRLPDRLLPSRRAGHLRLGGVRGGARQRCGIAAALTRRTGWQAAVSRPQVKERPAGRPAGRSIPGVR